MSQALIQRWAGFIAKIRGRFEEILAESEQGMRGLFAQHPHDFLPVTNAMSGLDARIRVLRDKLDETWEEQVSDKFADANIMDLGLDMKSDAELALEWDWAAWKAKIAVEFHRNLEPAARSAAAEPVHCTQCSMVLSRTSNVEMASITCSGCGALNQVAPSTPMYTYFGGMPRAVADQQTIELRRNIEVFRDQCDRWRRARDWAPEPLANFERWEQMEREFWVTHTRIMNELEGKPFDQALVDARMKQFIKYSLECEQVWVQAKGRVPWP
ncbi:hypothetical protein DB30_02110 [Enhygromyxa salina]|uniref:Uncharacterized protein n=1 Tax=Enhygromyxa salina TaxID=215803 RepID=A0A0C2CQM8_9BACT|nr:hypothetical protein [Enhygromyxa salina]KIG12025.1 hypothetical protein DB30_02110 [Enhygromyxa salina]